MANPAKVETTAAHVADKPYLGLRNIGLTVIDLDRTIAFYSASAPYAQIKRYSLPAAVFGDDLVTSTRGDVQIALIGVPTGFLQLMQFSAGPSAPEKPVPVQGPGYTHICFQSSSAEPALPRFMRDGLSLVSRCDERGVDLGGYGVRYAYGRDPEGRMIEVEHLDRPHRSERAWVSHLANVAHDHPAMLDFYTRLTGMPPHRVTAPTSRATFDAVAGMDDIVLQGAWYRLGNMELEVWGFGNPKTPMPGGRHRLDEIGYNAPAFEVADLPAECARLADLGVPLVGPELDLGGWRTRYAVDPEGNLFCVQQRASAPQGESVATS